MLVLQSRIFPINFPKEETIKIPTIIKAGAVTAGVTTLNNGEKNSASKKNPAVTTAVNPERPPRYPCRRFNVRRCC